MATLGEVVSVNDPMWEIRQFKSREVVALFDGDLQGAMMECARLYLASGRTLSFYAVEA